MIDGITSVKASEIVKPSNLGDFIRLQIACLAEDMEKIQFLVRFDHRQIHLPNSPVIELMALYEISRAQSLHMSLLVTDQFETVLHLFENAAAGKQIADELGIAWVDLRSVLQLQPVEIPKPWGKEVWYTGIEQRGVSRVKSAEGDSPLDWVIGAAQGSIAGMAEKLTLLKILDPLPDEVYGDLYFEMHEEKQEVYVVTHIDKQAWPDGKGGIRFGFNQQLRKSFVSDEEFKQAYLQAVQAYQQVRQQIDSLFDKRKIEEKIKLNTPVMPEKLKEWQKVFPKALLEQEKKLRDHMENFIAIKPLTVGDVIKVPCFTPHSLQHGVRTVEFQTPAYERKILSFAQKVLTQTHWDTESALKKIQLAMPEIATLRVLEKTANLLREEVVSFSDFSVERVTLAKDARMTLSGNNYRLLLVVAGEVAIEDTSWVAEDAGLIPVSTEVLLCARSEQAVLLLAAPPKQ